MLYFTLFFRRFVSALCMNLTSHSRCAVCCIGGGVAGLKAVHDIAEHVSSQNTDIGASSIEILLLEASDRLGGRIHSKPWQVLNTNASNKDDIHEIEIKIDVGAAYLHGIDQSNSEFIEFIHNQCGVQFTDHMTAVSTFSIHKDSVHPLIQKNCNFNTIPIYYQKHNTFYDLKDSGNIPSFIPKIDDSFEDLMDDIICMELLDDDSNQNENENENGNDDEQKHDFDESNDIETTAITTSGVRYDINKLPPDNLTFAEWLKSQMDLNSDAMHYAQLIYGTEDCIDIKKMGIRQYLKSSMEWKYGEEVIHLHGQYHKVVDYFADKLLNKYSDTVEISMESVVNKIVYHNDDEFVTIYTENGKVIECRYCICTVPLRVLQSGDIVFEPELPMIQQDAISKLHVGNGGKTFLQFNRQFWNDGVATVYVADSEFVSELIFMEYECPKDNANANANADGSDQDEDEDGDSIYVVSALSFAKQWTVFGTYSHQEIVKEIVSLLFQMFDITEDDGVECVRSCQWDWSQVDHINCAYSSRVAGSEGCVDVLSEPINNKIYFCGEGMVKSFAAIQCTMETASNVANQIKKSL